MILYSRTRGLQERLDSQDRRRLLDAEDKKVLQYMRERSKPVLRKMATNMKLFRNAGYLQRSRFTVLVTGCFLVSLTFVLVYRSISSPAISPALPSSPKKTGKNKAVEFQEQQHNYTIDDKEEDGMMEIDDVMEIKNVEKKLSCEFTDPRFDVCEMSGDIRIPGNSSGIIFVDSPGKSEAFLLRPYARKGDEIACSRVRELSVRSTSSAPKCTVRHAVPAVVFSAGGYAGNLFHDFTDVLIPLFLAAGPLDGEVQFVVTDMNPYWLYKYRPLFRKLSSYPVVNFDKDVGVHCFTKAIIGLRAHKELSVDPARAPNGYTMVDFGKFLGSALALGRESVTNIEDPAGRRPRILIIARKRSRAFVNLDEIVQAAEQLGFEVVFDEAEVASDVTEIARLVNSVDVLVGVHGAGLTNLVFLPPNATVVQVVPWGGLEWLAQLDFGDPAADMRLKYVQYSISIEESSLIEQYSRDHPMFKDPYSFHKQGVDVLRSTFMTKQNVRLDVKKFKNVLWRVLERIMQ